jgi:tungstate transport system ATP-binding protein
LERTYLAIKNLKHQYNGRDVINISELEIKQGEVLAVLGPNGSGKSTLLRLIGLLEKPYAGQIFFQGEDGWLEPLKWRRKIAAVFQEPLLFSGTVYDNVAYGLKVRKYPKPEIKRRVIAALEQVKIPHLINRFSNQLSGGEAQRVSLARAFVLEPEVLLLDEPLASLDPPTKQVLLEDLQHWLHESNITAVYVTHNRSEALTLADRIAILVDGCLLQVGSNQEVFTTPVNKQVADVVGVETIIPGEIVESHDGVARIKVNTGRIEAVCRYPVGEKVIACIRPEDIILLPESNGAVGSARNHLAGTIVRMINLGAVYRITVDSNFPIVAFVTKRSVDEMGLRIGSRVVVVFKATAVHVIKWE